MATMIIRFKGGPKDGAVLRVPYTKRLGDVLARYAVPLAGHYDVTTQSEHGLSVVVTWNDGATAKAMPLEPEAPAPVKTAWLLTAEGAAWAKSMDRAVRDGVMNPAIRDAVLAAAQAEKPNYPDDPMDELSVLGNAVADAGKRAGIIDPEYQGFSMPQLLHILDCMVSTILERRK